MNLATHVFAFLTSVALLCPLTRGAEPLGLPTAPGSVVDPFEVPTTTDASALVNFVNKLAEFQPHNQDEMRMQAQRMPEAVKKATKRILELEKDETADAARFARRYQLAFALRDIKDPTSPEAQAIYDGIAKLIEMPTASDADAGFAAEVVDQYVQGADVKKAIELNQRYAKVLAKSKSPAVVELGQSMEGSARRLDLPGKMLELKGTTVGGKRFDIASLKGHVVLVDFWATWCGFCVAEIPNIRKAYAGYHDKGFEVVGISADYERGDLDRWLVANPLPWTTLYENGGHHPAITYYGIGSFPTTFLLDREGHVVATEARGEELAAQLKRLLGEPAKQ